MPIFSNPHGRKPIWQQRFWWRGRRWYDPNEKKVIWTAVFAGVLGLCSRYVMMAFFSHYSPTLSATTVHLPQSGITGSPHDLSTPGMLHTTGSNESCYYCHTPAGSPTDIDKAIPDWNHETTTANFTMYHSPSLVGQVDDLPTGPSLVCLSCHDGTLGSCVLHETLGSDQNNSDSAAAGTNRATGLMKGSSVIGINLSNSHPISITYQDDKNKFLKPAGELEGVRLYPSNVTGAKVHCTSCHDPHNYGADGTAPFLRVSRGGSKLCLACHLM